jgi:hypothetical protein
MNKVKRQRAQRSYVPRLILCSPCSLPRLQASDNLHNFGCEALCAVGEGKSRPVKRAIWINLIAGCAIHTKSTNGTTPQQ